MSYVLNALNKSAQARATPIGAPTANPAPAPSARGNKRATLLRWASALLLALLGGVLFEQYRLDWPWYNREEPANKPVGSAPLPPGERELPVVKLSDTDNRLRLAAEEAGSTRREIWQDSPLRTTRHSAIARPLPP
ncbi:MAG: hypothetical protein H7835_15600 [Magnetococcus sp. XQGC-1]